MNSKRLLALVLVLVQLITGCGKQNETVEPTTEVTATTEPPVTTEASIPGLEDSIFDDETEPTVTETQPETTENTEPAETVKPTEPAQPDTTTPTTEPTQPSVNVQMDYERFQNLSASEQMAVMESFGSLDLFFAWYNQIKAEYEAANPPIDVGDGNIDIGDLVG